ncbi:MAG: hypothetical protein LZF61_10885 [Nitrosomonas sp.]|nr:MAG: hypothetical protein LZF61_10885 [Nitrosomonas sp.]
MHWYVLILLCLGSNLAVAEHKKPGLGLLVMSDPKTAKPKIVSEPGIFKQSDEITIISIPDMLRYCCAKIKGGGLSQSFAIRINSNTGQQLIEHHINWLPQAIAGRLAVAIKGNIKIIEHKSNENKILVDMDADGIPEAIKICASSEGVHMTAWSGSFKNMSRIWHAYYYLGQDLESNCSTEEIGFFIDSVVAAFQKSRP